MKVYKDNQGNLYYVWKSKLNSNRFTIYKKSIGETEKRWASCFNRIFDTITEAEIYLKWIAIKKNWHKHI